MTSRGPVCLLVAALLGVPGMVLAVPANPKVAAKPNDKLPLSGLPPAKLLPNLCLVKYRITTGSPECQAFFDQGLGFFYSYVWMEAVRSFETATRYDPDCPLAWGALSRALERYRTGNQNQ